MPEFTSPMMMSTLSRSISLWAFCTPVPVSLALSSTRSWTGRPRMPPFLFICSTVHLAPSTSLTARADRLPVIGSMKPIFTGVSPRALIMKGPVNCRPPTAAAAVRNLRRGVVSLILSLIDSFPPGLQIPQCLCAAASHAPDDKDCSAAYNPCPDEFFGGGALPRRVVSAKLWPLSRSAPIIQRVDVVSGTGGQTWPTTG